ncbi:class I SAM-dependent methyltransferase [Ectothiorhodospiraceae bacterium BW-2]|nr:class I SAM-dependent methyltransferase [Ectothiorhodospiraceae bacterium BW-2]
MLDLDGGDLFYSERLGKMERWYCRIFGVPIVGLRIRLRTVKRLLPEGATHILDAGCGRGVISRYLAKRYPNGQITAIDFDSDTQKDNQIIANRTGLNNIQFKIADLTVLADHEKYDLIVSVDNLEHVDDDRAVITQLYNALLPNGKLVVHVPHFYRRWPLFKWQENFDVPGHFRPGYHLPQLTERLERAGFSLEDSGYSYGFLENFINNISYWITGAREQNKTLYALIFPMLNAMAFLGRNEQLNMGAGVWVIAKKSNQINQMSMTVESSVEHHL